MAYKTFEDMKHDIPYGATHYQDEGDLFSFAWFNLSSNKCFVGGEWVSASVEYYPDGEIKPIPKTETPEEKEALDLIDTTPNQVDSLASGSELPNSSEWNGEGLPPVGAECEKIFNGKSQLVVPLYYDDHKDGMVIFYYVESGKSIAQKYDWCLVENCIFRKPETEAQKAERELDDLLCSVKFSGGDKVLFRPGVDAVKDALIKAGYRKDKA